MLVSILEVLEEVVARAVDARKAARDGARTCARGAGAADHYIRKIFKYNQTLLFNRCIEI